MDRHRKAVVALAFVEMQEVLIPRDSNLGRTGSRDLIMVIGKKVGCHLPSVVALADTYRSASSNLEEIVRMIAKLPVE